tara:strand:+ start:5593 stop:6075 length:483 start_codon:yes stop_codon:yes gene_type:complete
MSEFNIQTVGIDVDGTLSDGMYHVSHGYSLTKSFYTRDIWAVEELLKHGLEVIIITQSGDRCINNKLDSIKARYRRSLIVLTGVQDKLETLDARTRWDMMAYIGDAENDLECMKLAAFTACPSDAIPIIQEESHFVSNYPGGKGAVYDIVLEILRLAGKG